MTDNERRLTIGDKLGYASASLADALCYALIGSFLMFFLTTLAGIDPAVAGVITAVGAIWNALVNPVLGYVADQIRTAYGRRRPMMMAFAVPLFFSVLFLFTNLELPAGIKPIYYGILLMLYWTCFTGFMVPYLSLGALYTTDAEDRTSLRLYAFIFDMLGSMVSNALPTVFVALLMQAFRLQEDRAWSVTAGTIGLLAFLSILVTFLLSREKDPPCPDRKGLKDLRLDFMDLFRSYLALFRLAPIKWLTLASAMTLVANTLFLSDVIYFYTYNMALSAGLITLFMMARPVLSIPFTPVTKWLTLRMEKNHVMILYDFVGIALLAVLRIVGIRTPFGLVFLVLAIICCSSIYWQLIPAMYYDVADYDQYVTGHNRQGTVISLQGLVEAIATGAGGFILGVFLKYAGFDGAAATQTPLAETWIFHCTTLVPAVFMLLAAFSLWKYPLNRKRHHEIVAEMAAREAEEAENR